MSCDSGSLAAPEGYPDRMYLPVTHSKLQLPHSRHLACGNNRPLHGGMNVDVFAIADDWLTVGPEFGLSRLH